MKFLRLSLFVLIGCLSGLSLGQLPSDVEGPRTKAIGNLKATAPGVRFFYSGAYISRIYGTPLAGGPTPEDAFQNFLNQYGEIFAAADGEFRFEGTQDVMNGKFTAGYFREYVDNLPVDKGYLTILVKNQLGNPIVLSSASTHVVRSGLGAPTIPSKMAVQLLKRHHPTLKTFSEPSLVVWIDETQPRLAWTFIGENPDITAEDCSCHGMGTGPLPERVLAFVDAKTGRVLEERNQIFPVDVVGNVKGWASPGLLPDQTNNPETQQALELLRVSISGGNNALTNALGDYTITNPGNTPVTVNAALQGQWVNVINSGGANLTMSQGVTPPGPANFLFNPGMAEFDTAQVNAFIQVTRVHNFAKAILPSYPGIDFAIPTTVNISSSCNAYYSNNTINFYRAGGGCPNMAYSTVVWHEYGHNIIEHGHPFPTGDYHEGMSDVTANMLGDTPDVGMDFSGQGTGPLRSAYNSVNYPCNGEAHTCGQVISGAFWLTLDQLNLTVGHAAGLALDRSWYLNSILLHPPAIDPGITIDVLTLDDNDANLNNGTPHYNEIAAGFGAKNLDAPPIIWLTITPIRFPGEWIKDDPTASRRYIKASVTDGVGTQDPNSVKLNFRNNGGAWQQTNMPLYAQPSDYLGSLQIPPCGTVVDWYLQAKDTQGHFVYYPVGGANNPASFIVADDLITMIDDTFQTDNGWTVVNENLATGAWVRGDPNGTDYGGGSLANPENDSGDPGNFCWFTGQATVGGGVGDNDVDGGPTRLVSPTFDLAGVDAFIEFDRWFFNDDGDDAMTVQISNNNGTTWTTLETVMGIQNTWIHKKFRVSSFIAATSTMKIRFNISDNPNNSVTEGGVDHFIVKKIICD